MELMGGIDQLDDDWAFQLGVAFLDAAVACGFSCDRRFVADTCSVEACCDPCQLAAIVDLGWQPSNNGCLPYASARVTLLFDTCTEVPSATESFDPVKVNTAAQASLTARWQIMRGLQQARAAGSFGGIGCGKWTTGTWTCDSTSGGCVRWRTVWSVLI